MGPPRTFPATADGGPLAGNPDLRVEKSDGDWPPTQVWTTGSGEWHLYRFKTVALSLGEPVYVFERTLDTKLSKP